MRRPRGPVSFKQVLKWLALGVAILLAALLALGNNVGSSQPLGHPDRGSGQSHASAGP